LDVGSAENKNDITNKLVTTSNLWVHIQI